LDYKGGIDVRASSQLKRIDMEAQDAGLFRNVAATINGSLCGTLPNGAAVPCVANRHFTATPYPFQVCLQQHVQVCP